MTSQTFNLIARLVLVAVVGVLAFVSGVWGALALWYRLPGSRVLRGTGCAAWSVAVIALAACAITWKSWLPFGLYAWLLLVLLAWWMRIKPSHAQDWADDVAQMLCGTCDGDRVRLHNVRDFVWRSATDHDPRWVDREYDLQSLVSADVVISYWDYRSIAHVMVSFGFADGRHLVFSVEIRRRRGDVYSAIGGFFRQFETVLIAADESDLIGVRARVRDEDVYLYPLQLDRATLRQLFLAYVREANRLTTHPAFYNTATSNCTTIVYRLAKRVNGQLRWDPRLLFTGYLASYLYELGALDRSVPLAALRRCARVTERARNCPVGGDFSRAIRAHLPRDGASFPASSEPN